METRDALTFLHQWRSKLSFAFLKNYSDLQQALDTK
jgi:hypothetical protein